MRAARCVTPWCALVVFGALTAPPAVATPLDKRTVFTVSAPFAYGYEFLYPHKIRPVAEHLQEDSQ